MNKKIAIAAKYWQIRILLGIIPLLMLATCQAPTNNTQKSSASPASSAALPQASPAVPASPGEASDYPQPTGDRPFAITTEIGAAPWNPKHKLVQIGLQGKRIASENLPPSNLVFLVDVSGSMAEPNKLDGYRNQTISNPKSQIKKSKI